MFIASSIRPTNEEELTTSFAWDTNGGVSVQLGTLRRNPDWFLWSWGMLWDVGKRQFAVRILSRGEVFCRAWLKRPFPEAACGRRLWALPLFSGPLHSTERNIADQSTTSLYLLKRREGRPPGLNDFFWKKLRGWRVETSPSLKRGSNISRVFL